MPVCPQIHKKHVLLSVAHVSLNKILCATKKLICIKPRPLYKMAGAPNNGEDIAEALKPLTLTEVKPEGRELGIGAYGKVYTVKYRGVICAAKEIHAFLLQTAGAEGARNNFIRECSQCSKLSHVNVVPLVGIYYPSKQSPPVMVMELMGISVGGNMLTQVNSVRYLGVLIDPVLSWTLHINRMVSRVRSRLASIVRYGSLPPAVLCMLYSAFVMPLFDYCDVIWSPSTAKQTCLIEKVHSKFINKLPVTYHSKFPFTLTERRRFHTAIQIFKSLRQLSPPYLHDIFKFSFDITGHASRNINRLFVPRVFTNYGKKSFFYRGAILWNNLSWSHNIVVI